MTKEEAIQILSDLQDGSGQTYEAIRMAIEALQADAVKREEYEEVKAYMDTLVDAFIEDGEELAESVKVVRCKDCRYFKKIAERSDSGLCHRDIVASAWKEDGFCSRAERREP